MTGPFALPWPRTAIRAAIVWILDDEGFSPDQADAWADGWMYTTYPGLVRDEAVTFNDHGVPISQAIQWHQEGWYAGEALPFYDAGYTPSQAGTLCEIVRYDSDVEEWLATGLPPDRVMAYIRACVRPNEIADFEAIEGGPDSALALLAAFVYPHLE